MKTIRTIALALAVIIGGSITTNAQQKIGYVDGEALVYLLPEIKDVQAKLDKYTKDTLDGQLNRFVADYKEKDSVYKNPSTVASVKQVLEKDLAQLGETINNWQQIANQAYQSKQNQLLNPLFAKVRTAIQAVAKEKAYAYILSPEAIIVSPPGDDITKAVADKLGVKIPEPGATPAATK
ncbi:MAG: OmpH family outer membrane protein [Niabella sp.]